ncbi:MAG: hypothetical protein KF824_00480 [Fimbriimonadaceae bacterium]|nr:MAG: hypothetical protein KF824_00480 [Fimbriimonadaceae bacterium]
MRRTGFNCAILLSLCTLGACRSKPIYKFPTDENEFWSREAAHDDIQIFNDSYIRFANENAEILAKSNDSFDFPVASSYQTGLALLNATEGESYTAAARFLRTDQPDEFSLNQGFGEFLKATRHSVDVRSSLWMIWPIQVDVSFQKEMAGRFQIDTIRLGSIGITAQKAVKRWMDRFPPEIAEKNVELTKANQMIGLGGTVFEPTGSSRKLVKGDSGYSAVSDSFEIYFWEPTKDRFMPDLSSLRSSKGVDSAATSNPSVFVVASELDLAPLIRASQSERLLSGKNDFRHLSIELIDEASIPVLRQFTYTKIKLQNTLSTGEKPLGYAIYMKGSDLPIIIGKIAPNKQR